MPRSCMLCEGCKRALVLPHFHDSADGEAFLIEHATCEGHIQWFPATAFANFRAQGYSNVPAFEIN